MVSENASRPPRRPRLRWTRVILLALLALLLLLLLFAGWLFYTGNGARAAFSAIEAISGGTLQAQGVQGRLTGPLRLARLSLQRENERLTLADVRLDWQPSALLRATLHLSSLHVGHLAVTGKIDQEPEPAALPERIDLPFALQADAVRIEGGEINRGPLNLAGFGPVALSVDFDGDRYRLQLHEFAARSALEHGAVTTRFSGQAMLAATKPYVLQGSFTGGGKALIEDGKLGADGHLTLDGSLAELNAAIDFRVDRARITGQAILRPYSPQPLGAAQLHAQALDLSSLGKDLPQTALDIKLSAAENGAGELRLSNAAAGLYNRNKLPLLALRIAFRQNTDAFHFERIAAALGSAAQPAGEVSGSGRYAGGALTLALHTDALNLHHIDNRLRATRLAGQAGIRHADGRQEFTLALNEPRQRQRITLDAHGVLADAGLTIERVELQAGSGRITASGHAVLTGTQSFSAQGKISRFRLQDLGEFTDVPPLLLNGSFALSGARQPRLQADLRFDISDSRLAGQPLRGEGRAQLRGERLLVPGLQLVSGANRLNVEGQLAQGGARLAFDLDAPQLALFGPRFGGAIHASGTVRGTLTQPRIDATWNASNAQLPGSLYIEAMRGEAQIGLDRDRPFIVDSAVADISARGLRYGTDRLGMLSAQVRFAPQAAAPLALTLRAEKISAGELRADSFNASAHGTTARHAIDVSLAEPGQTWELGANGGLSRLAQAARWQGDITGFEASGRFNARLAAPAPLRLSAQRVQLDRFVLDADSGLIAVDRFARDADGIVTRGRIERLPLAQLLRYADPLPPIRTDLQLGGEWDVRIADVPSGSIRLRRERGDITVLGSAPVTLGLRTLSASASADNGRLALQLQADGNQLGQVDVVVRTAIGGGAGRMSIAPEAPLAGSVDIDMPSLGWIAPLVSPSLIADGRLQSEIAIGGTFGRPRFDGRIDGSALRVRLTDMGLDLRQGSLHAEAQGDRLLLRELSFQGGAGRLAVSGPIDLSDGNVAAQLALQAERFTLLDRSDRRLTVSGNSHISWAEQRAALTGAFTVDSGFFDIGRADTPQLSNDVVIAGREQQQGKGMALATDVTVSLGDGVVLEGRGLDALLLGEIRLLSEPGTPLQAHGTLRIAKGTYTAYGRKLAIEQGVLRFSGPLDNPALDILAMRRGQEVEAGVSVRGNALAPRVTLVSEPAVPDAEKLSWLVLGRGLAAAGEGDLGTLQSAAGALLSQSAAAGVQSRIASAFGLDTFSIGPSQDNLQQRIVMLGKQVSSRLYVGYQQGLETAGSVLQLRYILSPRLSIEAEAGARSAISLFYNIAFD